MAKRPYNNKPSGISVFPEKTKWAAIWFVLLGVVTLAMFRGWGGGSSSEIEKDKLPIVVASGPMPILPPSFAEETDFVGDKYDPESSIAGEYPDVHWEIDDPGGRGMCRFYQRLAELEEHLTEESIRVLHYGDSILTTDQLSGRVRTALQQRFGDGGHGFVLLGKPWRWYHHLGVAHGSRGKWRARTLTQAATRDGVFGLGGVSFETRQANAIAWAGTAEDGEWGRRVASFDVSYLEQPGGGSFDLLLNDELVVTIDTEGEEKRAVHYILNTSPGEARMKMRTRGDGLVRVFGAALESDKPGIVYDSLAINGARAAVLNKFDEVHWLEEIDRRKADLLVLMFGANEGYNDEISTKGYKKSLGDLLGTLKNTGSEEYPCLVVGPLDQAEKKPNGRLGSRRMPKKLSKIQRKLSEAHGCAFFDTFNAMGGENSMASWVRKGLGGGDFIHPTENGARKIGDWIADAIIAGYQRFLDGEKRCESSVTSL